MSLSWTGITENKILTDSDINRAAEDGFLTKKSQEILIPTGSLALTKSRLISYVNVNVNNSTLINKINNQLITKQDVTKQCGECTSFDILRYFEGECEKGGGGGRGELEGE